MEIHGTSLFEMFLLISLLSGKSRLIFPSVTNISFSSQLFILNINKKESTYLGTVIYSRVINAVLLVP